MNNIVGDIIQNPRRALMGGGAALLATISLHGSATAESTSGIPLAGIAANNPTLTFDDLGGGSPIIEVFPGVGNSAHDKAYNGTFNDGDRVKALCKRTGRLVTSHPEVGEEARRSRQWVKIQGTPGETQYATSVYVANPSRLLAHLRRCKSKR